MQTSNILAIGGLLLATKIWIDVCDIIKQNMKLNSYTKLGSCALDIMKILQNEAKKKRIKT